MTKLEWKDLLLQDKAHCYFKPTRRLHSSGYRMLEIGYLSLGDKHNIKDKLVLGGCSDVIYFDSLWSKKFMLNFSIDYTRDGYFRIFSHKHILWWGNMDFVVSSSYLEILKDIK